MCFTINVFTTVCVCVRVYVYEHCCWIYNYNNQFIRYKSILATEAWVCLGLFFICMGKISSKHWSYLFVVSDGHLGGPIGVPQGDEAATHSLELQPPTQSDRFPHLTTGQFTTWVTPATETIWWWHSIRLVRFRRLDMDGFWTKWPRDTHWMY